MIFTSQQRRISVPEDLPIWDFLFDSEFSPFEQLEGNSLAGFTNVTTKERVRYDDLKKYATNLSTSLVRRYGFRSGETVALFSPNTVWYPVAMLGTVRVGGIFSAASPSYNIEEMSYVLKASQAKILMTTAASLSVAVPAAQKAGIHPNCIFLLEGEAPGYTTLRDLLEIGDKFGLEDQVSPFQIAQDATNRNICGFLSFSSGTTGLPKAVMLSHQNVIAQCLQVQQVTSPDQKKILAALPLFHITGLVHQMHLPLLRNAEVYMLPTFTMEAMLDAIVEYQIPELLLVPPILIRLQQDPIVAQYDLSHVQKFSSGAAPLSLEILKELQGKFPETGFKQGYGMTETCSCIATHPLNKSTYDYGTRGGTLVANTEVKIIDIENKQELGCNETGEILARGPQVAMGYLNNEKATRETFDQQGWLHTGDVGYIDHEGFINITDRLKEMIKVKGIAVAPEMSCESQQGQFDQSSSRAESKCSLFSS